MSIKKGKTLKDHNKDFWKKVFLLELIILNYNRYLFIDFRKLAKGSG